MYPKLTYFLIIIAILVTSCSQDAADDTVLPPQAELLFDVSGLSRGSVTTSIDKFVVYGDLKSMNGESSKTIVMFNKKKVEYINGNWCYEGTQYWMPQYEHSFIAVYPESILDSGSGQQYLDSHLSFEYSVPSSGGHLSSTGDVKDILIATHRRYYDHGGADSQVADRITFTFTHILSLINLKPAFYDNKLSSDSYILFHGMDISGVSTKALFDIQPASRQTASQTDDMSIEVTGKDTGDLKLVFNTPVRVENDARNVSLFADDDALIMLPQDFAADLGAEITLSYTINDDPTMNYVSIPLKNLKWDSGRSYTYKFTIEKTGVVFDPQEITPWEIIQGDDISVD